MKTIEQRLDLRDNALNLIRLLLAVLVIVAHSFPISGLGNGLEIGGMSLGLLAVGGFFTISGYLITLSRYRTAFGTFAWRRFLRIMPAFWVCLIFTGFGAAAIAGAVRGGWSVSSAAHYVLANAPMMYGGVDHIGDTLVGAPFPGAWNGSLWTLRYEVLCYALVGIALLVGVIRRKRWLHVVAFVAATALAVVVREQGIEGPLQEFSSLLPFFLAGMVLLAYNRRIPLTGPWAAAAVVAFTAACATGYGASLTPLPLAYALLWAGVALPPALRKLGSRNDFSYGMYLYAFPIQQVLVVAGAHRLGIVAYILLSIASTIPLAVASWFAVEKPAQRLKNWRPFTRTTSAPRNLVGSSRQ